MKRFFVAALLFSIIGATGSKADSTSGTIDNPKQIPDSIVISSNRFPTPIEKIASSVTILTEDDIKLSQTLMVSDLLKQVPGLDVVRSGGAGSLTSVFMRGTNSDHTLVIIDGVEMNNPSSPTTSFDFGSLNVSNIQRIEVLRGPQSVMYGSDAIGGVIQIFTKRGFGDLQAEIISEAGSYNSFNESIHVSGNYEKVDYSLFASRKDTEGFSTIRQDAGGIEKDGFESTDFIGNIGIQLFEKYELTLNARNSNSISDIDVTFGILDDPNNSSELTMKSYSMRLNSYDAQSKYFKPEVTVALSEQELISIDFEDEMHFGTTSHLNSNGQRLKFSVSNVMNLVKDVHTIVGVEYEEEKYNSDRISSYYDYFDSEVKWGYDTVAEVSGSIFSLYGLDEWSVNDNFSISGGIRYDDHENFGSELTFRVTSLYKFLKSGLTLKAVYGSAFKAPSLYQIYNENYGNPDLQPEENIGWEVGFDKSFPDNIFSFGGTYFSNEIDNLIALDASYKPQNINEASTKGVEGFAQFNLLKSSLRIDVTYTDIVDKTNNSNLIRRPKEKISLKLAHQFSDALRVQMLMNAIGNRFDSDFRPWPAEEVVLEGYTTINMSASYQLLNNVLVTGRVENMFDEDFQDVLLYNTPGRSGYVGLKLSI